MTGQDHSSVHFQVLTLYPEIFASFLSQGLIGKAVEDQKLKVELINYRKKGIGKHLKVDSTPYGGGAGMVLRPEPIIETLEQCRESVPGQKSHAVLISPQGTVFNQVKAIELSRMAFPIVLICGRFEGFDERIRHFIDEEISLGDFVFMGGEVAAMAIMESVSRLVPGVIGNEDSLKHESFSQNLLEYPQYTRPLVYKGLRVPDVLTSGNHKEIETWRKEKALEKTKNRRPDLYKLFNKGNGEPLNSP